MRNMVMRWLIHNVPVTLHVRRCLWALLVAYFLFLLLLFTRTTGENWRARILQEHTNPLNITEILMQHESKGQIDAHTTQAASEQGTGNVRLNYSSLRTLPETQLRQPSSPPTCEELPCRNSMRPIDRDSYESCVRTTLERMRERGFKVAKRGDLTRSRCRLLAANSTRLPVFLASAPGCGNTWLRALLEDVTELCTGSVYCDEELRAQHFEAEGIRSGSVLVVKTHEPTPLWSWGPPAYDTGKNVTLFGSGILLIRNPLKSLVSHRKWVLGVTTNLSAHTAEMEIVKDTKWNEFIYEHVKRWVAMFRYLVTSSTERPVLLVSYEELVSNTSAQLERVLTFLGLNYDPTELGRHLISTKLTMFQRQRGHNSSGLLPFTAWQLDVVKKHVRLTLQLLDKYSHAQSVVSKYYSSEWI